MIAFLRGKVVHLEPTYVILDLAGVGYQVNISLATHKDIRGREDAFLYTYLNIREDAHVLFGFSTEAEKKAFQHLISVNGVGPGTAIIMLSYLTVDELRHAVLSEDIASLQAVKGIGAKTAQRLVIELKDKFRKDSADSQAPSTASPYNKTRSEALSALLTLGIPRGAAEKSVDSVLKKSGNTITLEDLVKQALKNS